MFNINNEETIWVQKYRPKVLDDYCTDEMTKAKFQSFIDNKDVPNLLFFGRAGGGKTTIGKILVNSLEFDELYINASDENNVETIRSKVKNFAMGQGFSKYKIVFLDECDQMTPSAQGILRHMIEECSTFTRFILTCNFIDKVIEPLQSRCQIFHIIPPSIKEIAKRLAYILTTENIKFDIMDIKLIVESNYPDIRRIIQEAQKYSLNGELKLNQRNLIEGNYALKTIDILKNSKKSAKESLIEIRQLFADSDIRDFTQLYQLLYSEVDSYSNGHSADCILKITEYEYQAQTRVIKELSAAALIISILEIIK